MDRRPQSDESEPISAVGGAIDIVGIARQVGRDIAATHYAAVVTEAAPVIEPPAERTKERRRVLSVENVTMGSVVKNMSFSVYEGEVVGMAGLVGSGRTEIAHVICGARKRNFLRGGLIYLNERPIRYRVPRQAVRDGIVYYHRGS
jgi:ABC-type sugar transport system ATPase subunit